MSLAEELNPRAVIGGNNPPTWAHLLSERHADALDAVDTIDGRANALGKTVGDDVQLGRVGDVVKAARQAASKLDTIRKAEVEPHLGAQREINGFFKGAIERLERIGASLEVRATSYQRAKAAEERRILEERARKEREEEDRQRAIAEEEASRNRPSAALKHEDRAEEAAERAARAEAAARASAADLTRVRSGTGTVATTRTSWAFEIVDASMIPLETLRPYLPRAEIEKALRSYVRMGGRGLAGVRIFENETASFR